MRIWVCAVFCKLSLLFASFVTSSPEVDVDVECANYLAAASQEDRVLVKRIRKNHAPLKHTWENITDLVKREMNHNKRNIAVTYAYEKHKLAKQSEWVSLEDYVKHLTLRCNYSTKASQGWTVKYVTNMTSCDNYSIVENMFPYNLEDDITNYTIWSVAWLGIPKIKELVELRFASERHDIAVFETPDRDKTIGFSHVHFFVRPKRTGDYFVFLKERN